MEGPTGPTGPTGTTAAAKPAGPYVEVTVVEPHGADLVFVRGFVDDVPVETYVKTADLDERRTSLQKRRWLAQLLRGGKRTAPGKYANVLGREDGI